MVAAQTKHKLSLIPRGRGIALLLAGLLGGCGHSNALSAQVVHELEGASGPWVVQHRQTFGSILQSALTKDAYVCLPSPKEVFFGNTAPGARTIHGTMPHYGFYYGPMSYDLVRVAESWRVEVRIGVELPEESQTMELPDCALGPSLEGDVLCTGTAYADSDESAACADSGTFHAPASNRNVQALLARWSSGVEAYFNRDASRFGLPVIYDFQFIGVARGDAPPKGVHLHMPLWTSCGRTPYFLALRTGWSLPVVAHEIGHVLGLLDEYEMFSGIIKAYPKTPFPGAELSRMGLSMKDHTVLWPVHHYLVLRRWFCPEPQTRNPFDHVLRD